MAHFKENRSIQITKDPHPIGSKPTSVMRPVRGLRPGARFSSQAHALATVYRTYGLVAKVDGDEFTPEELELLSKEQAQDEDQDAALLKAYTEYHLPYTERANNRARRLKAALQAARGLLVGNPMALLSLKKASFSRNPGRKKAKPEPATQALPPSNGSADNSQ